MTAQEEHHSAAQRQRDAQAIELIRSSGILNPDAKLEDLLGLTDSLTRQSPGHIFIFHEVVFIKCHF